MEEKWILHNHKKEFEQLRTALPDLDPMSVMILVNRGVRTEEEARFYLYGSLTDLPDPALLKDAKKGARLLSELPAGAPVAIAADYDVDGIFAGQILTESLEMLGFQPRIFTPNRVEEGYGLNARIVEDALAFGAKLLITCDNGIAAVEEVKLAKKAGMKVIVTDHHEPQSVLPEADALIDPKQADCSYPFSGICGAVVALKLMQVLYRQMGRDEQALLQAMLPYASIATVADMMDLREENRIIVREGLKSLPDTENPGLQALLKHQNLEGRVLTPYHIGFVLGPCFNAAGRLQTAELASRLLQAKAPEAETMAQELIRLNMERQRLTQEGVRIAEEMLAEGPLPLIPVLHLKTMHESVAGIVAGRLKESLHRPVLVITGEGLCKGSGRSIPQLNLFELMRQGQHLFEKFGGHAAAAGFSIREENIPLLRKLLAENSGLTEEALCPIIKLDAAMPPEYVTADRVRAWESLGPYGKGFERPLFGRSGITITGLRVLGQKRSALRLKLKGEGDRLFEGIWFGDISLWESFLAEQFGEKAFTQLERGQIQVKLALTYQPQIHEYQGFSGIQFQIKNYHGVT